MKRGDMPPIRPLRITQQDAADLFGIHVRTLRRYVRGECPAPVLLAIAIKLMTHFKLTPGQVRSIVWGPQKNPTILR